MCILCVPCAFSRLVTRRVSGNNAPLLLIKAFKHLCVVFVYSLCIQSSCDEEGFGKPCTSPPHKGVWAFVNVYYFLSCAFTSSDIFPCVPILSFVWRTQSSTNQIQVHKKGRQGWWKARKKGVISHLPPRSKILVVPLKLHTYARIFATT